MPAAPKAAAAPTPTAAELQALVATLEDDAAREELVARLKALTAAAPPEDERGAIADAIDSINHEIGERVDTVGAALAGLADSVGQAPVLARWSWQQPQPTRWCRGCGGRSAARSAQRSWPACS